MPTITIKYNARNTFLKKLIETILSSKDVILLNEEKRTYLDESITDVKKGRIFPAKSVDDLMSKIK